MNNSNAFDDYAAEYDRWFDDHKVAYEQELTAIKSLLPDTGSGVEIGAGTGRFAEPLNLSLGVEPSRAMREIATKRGVSMVSGRAESLPLGDELYDYALLVTTVCFLAKPETAFREIFRILRQGGFIVVGLIDKDTELGRKYQANKNKSKFYRNARFYSVGDILVDLKKAGFGNFECAQTLLPGASLKNGEPALKLGFGEGSFVVLRGQKGST